MAESPAVSEGERYIALIGDVVGSREIEGRAEVQRRLGRLLEELAEELGDAFAAPPRLTAGDEVQALSKRPTALAPTLIRIADELHPVRLTWGAGVGSLSTDPGPNVATLDGPCFHRARRAVEEAADADAWLRQEGFPPPHGDVLTALFDLMDGLRTGWTETQARYVRAARGRMQKEVAEELGVDKSTVSKALSAASFRRLETGEKAARQLLAWLGTQYESGGDGTCTRAEG